MKVAKLIISLDCEGKWGIADRAIEYCDFIRTQDLTDCYLRILDIFDRFSVKGTFAFVSALCLTPEELLHELNGVDLRYNSKNWLHTPLTEIQAGNFDGWSAPLLVDLVKMRGKHHICTHGGTHLPYSNELTPKDSVIWDIGFAKNIHSRLHLNWDTIVFPRNISGHLERIAGSGLRGYRSTDSAERMSGHLGKIVRVANEFIDLDRLDLCSIYNNSVDPLRSLSSGKFINAKIGIRKYIKSDRTINRFKRLINYACENDRIVHMYTHPHNFISDPSMYIKLERMLEHASQVVSEGRLKIYTMRDELDEIK